MPVVNKEKYTAKRPLGAVQPDSNVEADQIKAQLIMFVAGVMLYRLHPSIITSGRQSVRLSMNGAAPSGKAEPRRQQSESELIRRSRFSRQDAGLLMTVLCWQKQHPFRLCSF